MSSTRRTRRSDGGYVLVEVLLAAGILATVAGLLSLTFTETLRLIEHVQDDQRRERVARICLSIMAEELLTSRRDADFLWTGRNDEREGRPADVLALVSTGSSYEPATSPQSEAMRIVYAREGDRLLRWTRRNLYGLETNVQQTELATGVAGFNVRYFDHSLRMWSDVWDLQGRTAIPSGVLIELTLMNQRREPRTFRQWLSIPVQDS